MGLRRALRRRRRSGRRLISCSRSRSGVTTLCPCSKAISRPRRAQLARASVTLRIRAREAIWIEDLIAIVRRLRQLGTYTLLLKRQDEKAVTERAYDKSGVRGGPGAQRGAAAERGRAGELV